MRLDLEDGRSPCAFVDSEQGASHHPLLHVFGMASGMSDASKRRRPPKDGRDEEEFAKAEEGEGKQSLEELPTACKEEIKHDVKLSNE